MRSWKRIRHGQLMSKGLNNAGRSHNIRLEEWDALYGLRLMDISSSHCLPPLVPGYYTQRWRSQSRIGRSTLIKNWLLSLLMLHWGGGGTEPTERRMLQTLSIDCWSCLIFVTELCEGHQGESRKGVIFRSTMLQTDLVCYCKDAASLYSVMVYAGHDRIPCWVVPSLFGLVWHKLIKRDSGGNNEERKRNATSNLRHTFYFISMIVMDGC